MCLGYVQEGDPEPDTHPHARQDLGEGGREDDVPVYLSVARPSREDARQVLLVEVLCGTPRGDENLKEEGEGNHCNLCRAPRAEDDEKEEDQCHLWYRVGDVDHRGDEPVEDLLAPDEKADGNCRGKGDQHGEDQPPGTCEEVPLQFGRVLHHLGERVKRTGKERCLVDRVDH